MTKYVVPIDTPPPGADWSTVVPGIYLWDVVGITAELTTGGTSATVCPDASGNGNDGTYFSFNGPATFVPGLVPGDDALQAGSIVPPFNGAGANIPPTIIDWNTDFTIACLVQFEPGMAGGTAWIMQLVGGGTNGGIELFSDVGGGSTSTPGVDFFGGSADWLTSGNPIPADSAPHLVVISRSGPAATLYVDGAVYPWTLTGVAGTTTTPNTVGRITTGTGGLGILDEFALFRTALSAGDVAGLQTARGSFAAYNAAVMALSPAAYYHLDGGVPSTGRTPSLIVTNGTNDVLLIPDGFQAVVTPGPYGYAWQPGLNADTQSTDGTLTTVAIPALIIPAGYTVGTQTLDLQPSDQWSNVALWWDDSVQQLLGNLGAYDYGPGAHLLYRQIGT